MCKSGRSERRYGPNGASRSYQSEYVNTSRYTVPIVFEPHGNARILAI